MTITIYSTEVCAKCTMTKNRFDALGVEYAVVRIDLDETARDYCKSLGYQTMPVVVVSPTEHWADFRVDRIRAIAAAMATESDPALTAS